jgi:hypothetical protein
MPEIKHTPGPWMYDEQSVITSTGEMVVSVINDVSPESTVFERNQLEAYSNTRLIASAPDLLEACKEYLKLYDERVGPHIGDTRIPQMIRNAVNKAEGKE